MITVPGTSTLQTKLTNWTDNISVAILRSTLSASHTGYN